MRKPILTAVAAIAIALLATAAALAQTGPVTVTVTGVSISSSPRANDTYGQGETISVQVTFSHAAEVTAGSPVMLNLAVGRATRQASYASGSGTRTLTFSYTVQPGDLDADGVSVVQDSIQGSIIFQAGPSVSADLTYTAITNAPGHKVNATPPPLAFPATATVAAQTYTKGQTVSLALPEAAGGTAPLVYTLTAPTSSGATLPAGLAFDAITRTLSGTTTGWQAEIRYTYTVTDANRNTASLPVSITVQADFDADDDQLIEVHNLAQLDAIRWDMDGNGNVTNQSSTNQDAYRRAYPGISGMGCKSVDHDNSTTTPNQPVCIGYELNNDLDFDTDGDGATYAVTSTGVVVGDSGDAYYNAGRGWNPLWDTLGSKGFAAIFDGNGNTISNLFVNSGGGLFGGIGQCDAGGVNCRGEVKNLGLRNVKVIGGWGGALAGRVDGTVAGCYADGGSVDVTSTGASTAGGLIGNLARGTITGSYANVTVTSHGAGRTRTGGLVGRSSGTITASYATGDVRSNGGGVSGGLVGVNHGYGGTTTASYATGSVYASQDVAGSLAGKHDGNSVMTDSYGTGWVSRGVGNAYGLARGDDAPISESYWDTGTTGIAATTSNATGKTTVELQSPTTSAGIYANWSSDQWDFGTDRDYPAVKHNGVLVPGQRRTSIHADNRNAPVIGEPVVAALHVAGATSTSWQWQSTTSSGAWANIAGANAATYIPVAADTGRHLRAKVTFTASGRNQTLTTVNTAKVSHPSAAMVSGGFLPVPIVGEKIRFVLPANGAANPGAWRWKRCNDAAMQTGCKFLTSSEPANQAHSEYTPAAGTDTDAGKYLQVYVYYADSANNNAWTQAKTPALGPVAAAPPG